MYHGVAKPSKLTIDMVCIYSTMVPHDQHAPK